MSKVQGRDSDLFNEVSSTNMKDRCESCTSISTCNVCGGSISGFEHIGVRASQNGGLESGVWHYASPCLHLNKLRVRGANVKYNGGPLWKNGYTCRISIGDRILRVLLSRLGLRVLRKLSEI